MMDIQLKKWEPDFFPSLAMHANNILVAKNMTNGFPHPYTVSDAASFFERLAGTDDVLIRAIVVDGEACGSIGVFPQSDIQYRNAELGYWLGEAFWGKGIMVHCVKEMIKLGFSLPHIHRIFARPFGSNKASQRVLEKSGMILEATIKDGLYKMGKYEDELIYAVRKQE